MVITFAICSKYKIFSIKLLMPLANALWKPSTRCWFSVAPLQERIYTWIGDTIKPVMQCILQIIPSWDNSCSEYGWWIHRFLMLYPLKQWYLRRDNTPPASGIESNKFLIHNDGVNFEDHKWPKNSVWNTQQLDKFARIYYS